MIDMSKKYQTRDGQEVRLYAVDGAAPYPIHGAVLFTQGWTDVNWTADGMAVAHVDNHHLNLIEVKPVWEGWVNMYPEVYPTKEEANTHAGTSCIACIHVKFTEGEGLE